MKALVLFYKDKVLKRVWKNYFCLQKIFRYTYSFTPSKTCACMVWHSTWCKKSCTIPVAVVITGYIKSSCQESSDTAGPSALRRNEPWRERYNCNALMKQYTCTCIYLLCAVSTSVLHVCTQTISSCVSCACVSLSRLLSLPYKIFILLFPPCLLDGPIRLRQHHSTQFSCARFRVHHAQPLNR